MTKPCECQAAGWCHRHAIHKGEMWLRLCQNKESYRQAWDQGKGPGQSGQPPTETAIDCPFLGEDESCQLVSIIAEATVKTSNLVCKRCTHSSRPRRLNEINIALLPPDKIEKATEVLTEESPQGVGSDLEAVFGVFAKKSSGCACNGLKDALNTLTVEQIEHNKESIVKKIVNNAKKMGVPFASVAVRTALNAVLLKNKLLNK